MSIKIETKQCERCLAETFKGQLECDVCGLMPEGAGKADRTKIAERRKAALHKLGLYTMTSRESTCRASHSISWSHLDFSAEADLLRRAKSRHERALSLGYDSVAERFTKDATFAGSVLNEGENEYACPRYDLLWAAHLPKPDRTKAQVRLGISEQSQLEHRSEERRVGKECRSRWSPYH